MIFLLLGNCFLSVFAMPAKILQPKLEVKKVNKNGERQIGLNLLGFRADIGVRPILGPDGLGASVHALAQTPFGQYAEAGARGQVGITRTRGSVYAQATAGQGLKAAAAAAEGVVGHNMDAVGGIYAEKFDGDEIQGGVEGEYEDGGTISMLQDWMEEQAGDNILSGDDLHEEEDNEDDDDDDDEDDGDDTEDEENGSRNSDQEMKIHQKYELNNKNQQIFTQTAFPILRRWLQNQNFNSDKSRSKFSDKNISIKGNTDALNKLYTQENEKATTGIFFKVRKWFQNKAFNEDTSRSKTN